MIFPPDVTKKVSELILSLSIVSENFTVIVELSSTFSSSLAGLGGSASFGDCKSRLSKSILIESRATAPSFPPSLVPSFNPDLSLSARPRSLIKSASSIDSFAPETAWVTSISISVELS